MKEFVLFTALSILSITVNAQQNGVNHINPEQVNRLISAENSGGNTEPLIAQPAIDFNQRGISKALKEGNYEAASELFRKAVESDARCYACEFNLGLSLIKVDKHDEAIKIFNHLVEIRPKDADSYAGLAEAFDRKGLYQESSTAYQKAIELEPGNALLLANLGDVLYKSQDYKKALNYLDQAIFLNQNFATAHGNRGVVLFALNRPKEAIKSLQRALDLNPAFAEALNNYGVILTSMGDKKEAHKHFLEAVRLRPYWSYALYNLALSHLARGERESANQQLLILKDVDSSLAEKLKKSLFSKYIIDASDVKSNR